MLKLLPLSMYHQYEDQIIAHPNVMKLLCIFFFCVAVPLLPVIVCIFIKFRF